MTYRKAYNSAKLVAGFFGSLILVLLDTDRYLESSTNKSRRLSDYRIWMTASDEAESKYNLGLQLD
jgi:hypothetical protein